MEGQIGNGGRKMPATFDTDRGKSFERSFAALVFAGLAAFACAQGITEFPVPGESSQPRGLAAGPGQTVWYGTHSTRKIGRIDLTLLASCQANANACMTEYAIPNASAATDPYNLVKGSDGAIWFTEGGGNKLGRLDPAKLTGCSSVPTTCITEYATSPVPFNIALGPDGNIWFSDSSGIGRVDLTKLVGCETVPTTCITHYPITGNNPVAGQDGNVWCLLYSTPAGIGRIDLSKLAGCESNASRCLTAFPLPSGSHPDNAVSGSDGNVWFTDEGPKIGRIALSALASCGSGSCITEFPVGAPFVGNLASLTSGPDAALWFLDNGSNSVGRITTSGQVTNQYPIPTANSGPQRIRTGPDGNLWFTEDTANKIGRVTFGGGGNPTPTPTRSVTPTPTPTGTSQSSPRSHVTPLHQPTPKTNVNGRQ